MLWLPCLHLAGGYRAAAVSIEYVEDFSGLLPARFFRSLDLLPLLVNFLFVIVASGNQSGAKARKVRSAM